MRFPARLSLTLVCCAAIVVSACSDSTNPDNSQDAPHLALHFDSLFTQVGDSGISSGRGLALSYLEISAALGATPANITVTTANGTEHWKGYEIEEVSTGGCSEDTSYLTLAYRDADAHTVMLAFFDASGAPTGEGGLLSDSLTLNATGGDGSTSRTSLGASCSTISSALSNPFVTGIDLLSCNLADFETALSLTFPSAPGLDPALLSVSIGAQTFKGVRVEDNIEGSTVRRAHALLRAAQQAKHL